MNKYTIMADYSSTGLWLDGIMVSFENFPKLADPNEFKEWMDIFESYNFHDRTEQETNEIYKKDFHFIKWLNQGMELAKKLNQSDLYIVEYFDETSGNRIIL
jgi:hypothetical protein